MRNRDAASPLPDNRRAVEIADQVVPAYRAEGACYSCTGQIAHCWQAAHDGAAAVLSVTPAGQEVELAYERAYFERGFIASYAWAATKLPSSELTDAVIDRAWEHRDEGMDAEDILPVKQSIATPSVATPADDAGLPSAALPESIGRFRLGDRRADGERLCSHSHDVPAGHPLYWPERMGEYPDDVDPLCLAHAIKQAESDSGFCATCAAAEFGSADDAEVTQADRDAAARHCLPRARAANMRAGLMDGDLLVQEFASHRAAASPKVPSVAMRPGIEPPDAQPSTGENKR